MTLVVRIVNQIFPNNPFWAGKEAVKCLERRASLCIQSYEQLSTEIQSEVDKNHFAKFLQYEHNNQNS